MNKKSILTKALCAFAISIAPTFSWATNFERGTSIGTWLIRNDVDGSQLMKMSDVFNNYSELLDTLGNQLAGANPYIIIPKFVAGYKYVFKDGNTTGAIPPSYEQPTGYVDAIYDYVFQINSKKYLHILTTIVQSVDQTFQNVTSSSDPSFTKGYNSGIIDAATKSFSTPYTGEDVNKPNVPYKYPDALRGNGWLWRNYKMTQNLPSFLGVNNENPPPSQQVPVYREGKTKNPYYGILTNEFCASRKLPLAISSKGFNISTSQNQEFFKTQLARYPAAYNVYCYPNSSTNPTVGMSVFSTTLYLLVTNTQIKDSKGKTVYFNLNQDAGQDKKVRDSLSSYISSATSLFCLDIMNANLDISIFKTEFLNKISLPIDPTKFTSIEVPQKGSYAVYAIPVSPQGFGGI